MGDFSIVGTRYGRIDGRDKATGRARYINDLNFPGMLYGSILRSPYPHARIRHIDTSRAEKLMGVRAVATASDTPNKKYGAYRSGVQDELIFAQGKVRYVGDEVAAVAAIDEETAREAISRPWPAPAKLPGVSWACPGGEGRKPWERYRCGRRSGRPGPAAAPGRR